MRTVPHLCQYVCRSDSVLPRIRWVSTTQPPCVRFAFARSRPRSHSAFCAMRNRLVDNRSRATCDRSLEFMVMRVANARTVVVVGVMDSVQHRCRCTATETVSRRCRRAPIQSHNLLAPVRIELCNSTGRRLAQPASECAAFVHVMCIKYPADAPLRCTVGSVCV